MTIKKDKYSFSTQKDIIQFLNELESRFPVNDWMCNGVHIWPVIRFRLAEYMLQYIRQFASKDIKNKVTVNETNYSVIKKIARNLTKLWHTIKYVSWQKALPPDSEILFVGAPHYREEIKGVSKNKFFDPIIEEYGIEHFYWLDIGSPVRNPSWPEKMLDYESGSKWFLSYRSLQRSTKIINGRPGLDLPEYELFRQFLQTIEQARGFSEEFNSEKLIEVMTIWQDYYYFFHKMLKRMKPSRVFLLCYFDLPRMALSAAASHLDIPVIEIQHGTVDIKYYQRWSNLPEKGYEMLPKAYWCWNTYSKQTLDEWTSSHPQYRAFVGGNPWVNYWKSKQSFDEKNEEFILYTLQDLDPADSFQSHLLEAMQNTEENWYIRLHPKFSPPQDQIVDFLAEHGLFQKTNFKEANQLPLAVLLRKTVLHITASSSSAMEASLFGVKTLFLDKISEEWFPVLFQNGYCKYLDPGSKLFRNEFLEYYNLARSDSGDTLKSTIDKENITWALNRREQ